MVNAALPAVVLLLEFDFGGSAGRTGYDTLSPTSRHQVRAAVLGTLEKIDRFQQRFGFLDVFHVLIYEKTVE